MARIPAMRTAQSEANEEITSLFYSGYQPSDKAYISRTPNGVVYIRSVGSFTNALALASSIEIADLSTNDIFKSACLPSQVFGSARIWPNANSAHGDFIFWRIYPDGKIKIENYVGYAVPAGTYFVGTFVLGT